VAGSKNGGDMPWTAKRVWALLKESTAPSSTAMMEYLRFI
jgi:hypothetical protein